MNAHSQPKLSLIERAAQVYGFDVALRSGDAEFRLDAGEADVLAEAVPTMARTVEDTHSRSQRSGVVDRAGLEERGFVLPDAPVGTLAEELRIVKRSLLASVRAKGSGRGQIVMICSARPDDGKTFTAVNLALSLAGERDVQTLLVDGDIAKPEVLSTLGLAGDTGLVDALCDPQIDVGALVIRTDIGGLSVLPAGRQTHDATELLASSRMAGIVAELTSADPSRIVLIDTPPALAASAASAIAGHAGQVLMVVRADRTSDADLREAVTLVGACPDVKLILNGTPQMSGRKRFSYYGVGQ